MTKQNVKQIVQQLAKENINSYPGNYPMNGKELTEEGAINLQELAKSYYDNRTDEETERDQKLGIDPEYYAEWVAESFREYLQSQND